MAIQVTDEPKKNYLLLAVEGGYSYPEAGPAIEKILAACEKHQPTKVLMDARKLIGSPTTLERFNFAIQFTVKYFVLRMSNKIPSIRFAFVASHPFYNPSKIAETVAVNRGLLLKVTTSLQEALDWLCVEEEK